MEELKLSDKDDVWGKENGDGGIGLRNGDEE